MDDCWFVMNEMAGKLTPIQFAASRLSLLTACATKSTMSRVSIIASFMA